MIDTNHRTTEEQELATRYSASAANYAKYWSPVIRPMGQRLIRALPIASASRVLDVGTGVGALVPDIRAAAPNALVVGVDGSVGMLRVAQTTTTIPLAAMDASRLGFGPNSFDAAVLAFVLFHLPDPIKGLIEIRRVLRSGGALGVATWGPPRSFAASDVWDEALSAFGAGSDPLETTDRDELMDTPEKLAALLSEARYEVVESWNERFEHRWTPETLIAQRIAFGSYQRRLDTLDEPTRTVCLARVREQLSSLPDDDLVFRPDIVFAVGRRRENNEQAQSRPVAV